jgi:PAS domain-containing protein
MGFLEQLPAVTLLDRLPTPIIAVGLEDGALVYANPASAELLGYADGAALTAQSLPALMAEHALTLPRDCIAVLVASAATFFNHTDGYLVRAIVSQPFLRRQDDPVLLVGLTDITEMSWNNGLLHPPTLPARRDDPARTDRVTAPPAGVLLLTASELQHAIR